MNATIPDSLRDFVLARVADCGFTSIDEYIGRLVEADLANLARERLEEELLHGLGTERTIVSTDDFDQLRASIRSRHAGGAQSR